jgi:Spy/CpxP family protein refolding chaperone
MTDISSISQSAYAAPLNPYAAYNLQQYSDLGLSESQRTQIRSIVRSAQSDGLTQAQVQQQIGSVLTPQQLSQLQSESGSSSSSSTSTSSSSATSASSTTSASTTNSTNPFANLNLSSSEESQIEQLLQNAGSSGIALSQFTSDLSSILTPAQQSAFQSDVQSVLQQFNAAANSQAQTNSGPTNPFSDPNGPFANLNLTSSQQSQIQQILQSAQSQGLSLDQVNSQINAILTPTQQTAFASDLQNLQQQQQQAQQTQSSQSAPNPFSDPNGPFANLNLTSSQQSQIQQILQSAQSQGLSLDQVNSQIVAVLTSSQQSTFATDLLNSAVGGPQSSSGTSSSSSTSSGSTATTSDIFDNLNLTSSQKTDIQNILQSASSDGLSASDVLVRIQSVLSSSQQTTLAQNIQTMQADAAGTSGHRSGGTSVTDTQSQIAAANAAVNQFLQNELNTLGVLTGSTSS